MSHENGHINDGMNRPFVRIRSKCHGDHHEKDSIKDFYLYLAPLSALPVRFAPPLDRRPRPLYTTNASRDRKRFDLPCRAA